MRAYGFSDMKGYASFLGLGFYWAWVATVFYSDVLFPFSSGADALVESFWLWATWAHALALVVFVILARRVGGALSQAPLRWIASCGMVVGMLILVAASALLPADSTELRVMVLVASVVIGLCTAWHILIWGGLYARMPQTHVVAASLLSIAAGLLAYFLLALCPSLIRLAMVLMMPLFSLAAMGVSLRSLASVQTCAVSGVQPLATTRHVAKPLGRTPEMKPSGFALSVVALFVFALCGEMLRVFSLQLTDVGIGQTGALYLFGGLIGLLLLVGYFAFPIGNASQRRITLPLVRAVLIIMAVAFLAAPFLGGYSFAICYGIFGAGFWCFRAISWVFCVLLVAKFACSPVRVIGILDGAFALSVVVSAQVNSWLAESIRVGATGVTTVSLVTVFVLMFIAMFVLNGRQMAAVLAIDADDALAGEDVPLASRDDILVASVASIAQEFGLSPRETEVAELLAKGRSLPFIQNELYISAGTAQTHARHIYKKLNIHSRQEFLDIVEQRSA